MRDVAALRGGAGYGLAGGGASRGPLERGLASGRGRPERRLTPPPDQTPRPHYAAPQPQFALKKQRATSGVPPALRTSQSIRWPGEPAVSHMWPFCFFGSDVYGVHSERL